MRHGANQWIRNGQGKLPVELSQMRGFLTPTLICDAFRESYASLQRAPLTPTSATATATAPTSDALSTIATATGTLPDTLLICIHTYI
jgi:hypothetical protein